MNNNYGKRHVAVGRYLVRLRVGGILMLVTFKDQWLEVGETVLLTNVKIKTVNR